MARELLRHLRIIVLREYAPSGNATTCGDDCCARSRTMLYARETKICRHILREKFPLERLRNSRVPVYASMSLYRQ